MNTQIPLLQRDPIDTALFDIAIKSEMIKSKLDKTDAKLQFIKTIFSFFSNNYNEINQKILKNVHQSVSKISIRNSEDYKLIRKIFKDFKREFARNLRSILSQEEIKKLANPETNDFFIKNYGSSNPKLNDFYKDLFFKFIAAIQQEPKQKRMRIDWLCNQNSQAEIRDDQMFAATNPQEKKIEIVQEISLPQEKEKEIEIVQEISLPQEKKNVDPKTYDKIAVISSLNVLITTLASGGEILSTTNNGKLHYWNSNFSQDPLNPRLHTPMECKKLTVNANESFAVCVGNEANIALFGPSPSGSPLSFVERKPIQHNFNFLSAITAASLYENIVGFGFQNGNLEVFNLNESYREPIFKITGSCKTCIIASPTIQPCSIDPFGSMRIYTLRIEKDKLIVGGGGYKTAVVAKIEGDTPPLVFRGYRTMINTAKIMRDSSFLTGSRSGEIIVWDLVNFSRKFSLMNNPLVNSEGNLVDLAPDFQGFYALYQKGANVYYYDKRLGNNPVWKISQNGNLITSMAFDAESSELYLTSQNQIVTKWRGKKTLVEESEITSGERRNEY